MIAAEKLSTCKKKRDFKQTHEPSGSRDVRPSNRPHFIIQKHATRTHYDLQLELDSVFKSWAVTKGPSLHPGDNWLAGQTPVRRTRQRLRREDCHPVSTFLDVPDRFIAGLL